MVLHTLSAGPDSSAFSDCLRVASADDAILLMGNGVYIAVEGTQPCSDLVAAKVKTFVLEADARAAGITDRISSLVSVVDFDRFVELSEQFPRQLAWY
ncbi:MAG: sulfurtransferase complex subunit TusB [Halioglobus sp.]